MGNVISNLWHKEFRALMIGSDMAGKTTILYKLKLGDKMTQVIPTIGFGVETCEINIEKNNATLSITVWDLPQDVNDTAIRLRPLWRHYFAGTDCIIWCIDSTLNENKYANMNDVLNQNRIMMNTIMSQPELKIDIPLLIYVTKTDSKTSMSTEMVEDLLHFVLKPEIDDLRQCCLCDKMDIIDEILFVIIEYLPGIFAKDEPKWMKYKRENNLIHFQRCCGLTGEGLIDGLEWLTSESIVGSKRIEK